ncbi:FtsX-like permease family protein [Streptococcus cuniculi]|uniref:FtsX-like permease family protein n=1 Tax=Streptococcus cuniculi TaxID=1432788 RepID=A0A4Y9JAT8_9STRE|nr:FtsX-like permease family protein [Streptococcus cuniculi]MBF0778118.1 FtsX-like permease family protein [Streptococcus cuniculi]TFU98123.1 FtsX-like permease family protein [Streptococcus cuniculi]
MWKLAYKLAWTNLLKNRNLYYPFALVTVFSAAIAYLFTSLSTNPHLVEVEGARGVTSVLKLGQIVVMIAVAMMLFYANSFVMKNRSKELGIYTVLGLEKRQLLLMTLFETILFSTMTVSLGLVLGVLLDKLMYAILLKAMHFKVVLASVFQWENVLTILVYFTLIFLLVAMLNAGKLSLSSSLNLVKGRKRGEGKGRFLLPQTLLGLAVLGGAYYLAQTVSSPVKTLPTFFTAVLIVIFATYLLFNAGIISLLKWLQKRQAYYYQPANFISVSNLVFRMRKNAMGLATIAILSTMFIVTMIGGINIYVGGNDMINLLHPNDFTSTYFFHKRGDVEKSSTTDKLDLVTELTSKMMADNAVPVTKMVRYSYIEEVVEKIEDNRIKIGDDPITPSSFSDFSVVYVFDEASYEQMTGETLGLSGNQVAVYAKDIDLDRQKPLMFGEQAFTIEKVLPSNFTAYQSPSNMTEVIPSIIMVVQDLSVVSVDASQKAYIGVDTSLSEEEQAERWENFRSSILEDDTLESRGISGMGQGSRAMDRISTFAFSGSLFFIGVFLSIVFLMATVLVIYYKQISEAYEDRDRFVIMQKVGLDHVQTKQSIRKQMVTVFFLPLIFAFIHLIFAYKMLMNILRLIGVLNGSLVMQVAFISCLGYLVLYVAVYLLTSRSYRKIISAH